MRSDHRSLRRILVYVLAYFPEAFAATFFATLLVCPVGLAAFWVAACAAAVMAIFFAVSAFLLARVLLDLAMVFPVPLGPLRIFDRLVVMNSLYFAQARSILPRTGSSVHMNLWSPPPLSFVTSTFAISLGKVQLCIGRGEEAGAGYF